MSDHAAAPILARALWDYEAIEVLIVCMIASLIHFQDNELSFKAEDIIHVIELCNDDWYEGRIGTAVGYFPANRVERLDPSSAARRDLIGVLTAHDYLSDNPREDTRAGAVTAGGKVDLYFMARGRFFMHKQEPARVDAVVALREPDDPFADDIENHVERGPAPVKPGLASADGEDAAEEEDIGDRTEAGNLLGNLLGEEEQANGTGIAEGSADARTESVGETWKIVRNETGETYYWNEETGTTAWELPDGHSGEELMLVSERGVHEKQRSNDSGNVNAPAGSIIDTDDRLDEPLHSDLSGLDLNISLVDQIPSDLIRKEGFVKRKLKKEDGGKEARISATWKTFYAVACVGFLVFFKEAPAKSKKSSPPLDILPLTNVGVEVVGKDQTTKKSSLVITTESGRQWIITPDADVNGWFDVLKGITKDRVTTAEVYLTRCGFILRSYKSESDLLNVPGATKSKRSASAGKEKEGGQALGPYDDKTKSQVRSKLSAFFSKRSTLPTRYLADRLTFKWSGKGEKYRRVAAESEVNKMERSNLAIVFAPTLIRTPDEGGQVGYFTMANMPFHNTIIEAMLEQCEWLFNGKDD
ncbi:hypothetical protein HK101_011760 [Irineochytrium annulatum]|nr:hypothetical protein HK101_011760 [Irineochytrium annulatum]